MADQARLPDVVPATDYANDKAAPSSGPSNVNSLPIVQIWSSSENVTAGQKADSGCTYHHHCCLSDSGIDSQNASPVNFHAADSHQSGPCVSVDAPHLTVPQCASNAQRRKKLAAAATLSRDDDDDEPFDREQTLESQELRVPLNRQALD